MGNGASTPGIGPGQPVIASQQQPDLKPGWAQDAFWPKPEDSVETLQQKAKLNHNAAWGEIGADLVSPDRPSDVTENQSNELVANEYIQQKQAAQNNGK
jgi:hypothetical protein